MEDSSKCKTCGSKIYNFITISVLMFVSWGIVECFFALCRFIQEKVFQYITSFIQL